MRVSTLMCSAFAGLAAAAPYYPFPLKDGFPSPSPAQLKAIQKLAGGSLPGGALPTKLSASSTVTLQLLALNEIFEVAYFNQLLDNLNNNAPGYTTFPAGTTRAYAIESIQTIRNQEELHAAGVNAALATAGQQTIAPCSYNIPVTSYASAIALANTFTDVVLGVLPQAQAAFAADPSASPFVSLFGSVIAQEGEQNGWYRAQQTKVPSASPFLTTEGPTFAFSFLKSVIAPGCAGVDLVSKSVPTYPALTVNYQPGPKDQGIRFTVQGVITAKDFSIVYLSGHNLPASVSIYDVKCDGKTSTFKANFPFATDGFSQGLTVAALVKGGAKAYASISDVAAATAYGPGIIEVE